jgi:hypothetical protein
VIGQGPRSPRTSSWRGKLTARGQRAPGSPQSDALVDPERTRRRTSHRRVKAPRLLKSRLSLRAVAAGRARLRAGLHLHGLCLRSGRRRRPPAQRGSESMLERETRRLHCRTLFALTYAGVQLGDHAVPLVGPGFRRSKRSRRSAKSTASAIRCRGTQTNMVFGVELRESLKRSARAMWCPRGRHRRRRSPGSRRVRGRSHPHR